MSRLLFKSHRMQSCRGQSLPLGLAFILFGALFTLVLFNSSQLFTEKSKVVNTADAAAYSGLVWQARALNFTAYTNRAMVANQVSIAQFVSLSSWTKYGLVTAENLDATIGWIPFIKPYTQAVETAMEYAEKIVGTIAAVAVPVLSGVNVALAYAQEAVYYSTFAVTPEIVKQVVKENDSRFKVNSNYAIAGLGQNGFQWNSYIKKHTSKDDLLRKADVINRSRDDFTTERNWHIGTFWLGISKHRIQREGATHLVYDDGEWAWKAKDTLSLHNWHFRCGWTGCRWKHKELPIGWGAVYASEDLGCDMPSCPRWVNRNRKAERQAHKDEDTISGYHGVQAYYDLKDLSESNKDPRFLLRIEVSSPEGSTKTTENIEKLGSKVAATADTRKDGTGRGIFHLDDQFAGNSVAAISTAELYFERPILNSRDTLRVRGREQTEYASLWNPYWQVRLADTPKNQKLAAWTLRSPDLVASTGSAVGGALRRYVANQSEELEELKSLEEYSSELSKELPDIITRAATVESELKTVSELKAMAESDFEEAKLLEAAAASRVLGVESVLSSLEDEKSEIEAKLASATSSALVTKLEGDLASVESKISSAEASLSSVEATYSDIKSMVDAKEGEVFSLAASQLSLESEFSELKALADTATSLGTSSDVISDTIDETKSSIASASSSAAKDVLATNSTVAGLASSMSGSHLSYEMMKDFGEGYLEDAISDGIVNELQDQLEEAATAAIKNAVSSYAGDYSSYTNYAKDAAKRAESVAATVEENYIEPIERQIAEAKAQLSDFGEMVEDEMKTATASMEEDLAYLEWHKESLIEEAKVAANKQLTSLSSDLSSATDPTVKTLIKKEMEAVSLNLEKTVSGIESSMAEKVATLQNSINEIRSSFEAKVKAEKERVMAQISDLEKRIQQIKNSMDV